MNAYEVIDTVKLVNERAYSTVVQKFATDVKAFNAFTTKVSANPYEALVKEANITSMLCEVELHSLEERLCVN